MTCEPLRFVRSPNSTLDYTVDWSGSLAVGDTITESTWASVEEDGLTVMQDSLDDTSTTVWLSGGIAGSGLIEGFYPFNANCTYYHMINTIVTANGRTDERTVVFLTREE